LRIGKKSALEIIAKCFHNDGMKGVIDAMMGMLEKDETLSYFFLEQF
jgi:hypothetical protein